MARQGRPPYRHPHRLSTDRYQKLFQPVFFTLATDRRLPVLTSSGVPQIVLRILDECAEKHSCALIAFCVMPDHVHLLTCVVREGGDAKRHVDEAKSQSGHELTAAGLSAPIWQRSYFDRHLRARDDLGEAVEYILLNPVEAGLCASVEDWPYSGYRGRPWDDEG